MAVLATTIKNAKEMTGTSICSKCQSLSRHSLLLYGWSIPNTVHACMFKSRLNACESGA